jgi:Tol biopolymer transport system component
MNIRIGQKLSLLGLLALLLTVGGITSCNVLEQDKDQNEKTEEYEYATGLEGKVVFSMFPEEGEFYQLFSIDPDGSNLRQLTNKNSTTDISEDYLPDGDLYGFNPSFNNDGSKILLNVHGGINDPNVAYMLLGSSYVYSVDDLSRAHLDSIDTQMFGDYPRWSSDEERMLIKKSHSEFNPFVYDIQTKEMKLLGREFPEEYHFFSTSGMVWNSDDSKIAFLEESGIFVVNSDGTDLRKIIDSEILGASRPVWHSQEDIIAANINGGDKEAGLYQIDAGSGEMELILSDEHAGMNILNAYSWSENGNYILVRVKTGEPAEHMLMIFDSDQDKLFHLFTSPTNSFRGADMYLKLEN